MVTALASPVDRTVITAGHHAHARIVGPCKVYDGLMNEDQLEQVRSFLAAPGWESGWKSNPKQDHFGFWHKHFAGSRTGDDDKQYNCEEELGRKFPGLGVLWVVLRDRLLPGHRLCRCYANGMPYGTDGTVHTDSQHVDSHTAILYSQEWSPNWGGETVFFNRSRTDITQAIYPKQNRMIVFPGMEWHVARAVSRSCPEVRTTLMFKSTDTPAVDPAILAFLRERTQLPHSGRTLYQHLKGTYHLLKARGYEQRICLAGLFHSIYGTPVYQYRVVPLDERPKVRELIGEEAERCAFVFSTLNPLERKTASSWTKAIDDANIDEQKL